VLESSGSGAGTRDGAGTPNILRVLVGEAAAHPGWTVQHGMRVVEANVDDLSPQLVADAIDALFAAGAVDAWVTPIQMKRGRLAVTVSALADPDALPAVKEAFFRATTTLGVREYAVARAVLDRDFETVEVRGGLVRLKRGRLAGAVTTVMPEHGDLQRLAAETGIPVRQLWLEAMAAARDGGAEGWTPPADREPQTRQE
ncbi:MAG: LarC family nickel insertion protein, partial [Chloroflexota bacterium]|nr:LarC family nickel insertion protein [Chloroflexota bacterium]